MPTALGIVRIPSSTPGECCPCGVQVGCACLTSPCVLACQSKAAIGTICGFEQLGTPADPPQYFRKQAITTGDTFLVCGFPGTDCTPPDCPSDKLELSFDEIVLGVHIVGTGTLTGLGTSGGVRDYEVTVLNGTGTDGGGGTGPLGLAVKIGTTPRIFLGDTQGIGVGVTETISIQWFSVAGWIDVVTGCLLGGDPVIAVQGDKWDYVQEYQDVLHEGSATTCDFVGTTTQEGRRSITTKDTCILAEPLGVVGLTDPDTEYGGGVSYGVVNLAQANWGGVGCVNSSGVSHSWGGTITLDLSDEDTEEDAIARAAINLPWLGGACLDHTSWITNRELDGVTFGFSIAQTKATLTGLTVGLRYLVTIYFTQRILGSGGPYLPASVTEITFTAEHTTETTAWVDLPNERGFQTLADHCTVELAPE